MFGRLKSVALDYEYFGVLGESLVFYDFAVVWLGSEAEIQRWIWFYYEQEQCTFSFTLRKVCLLWRAAFRL